MRGFEKRAYKGIYKDVMAFVRVCWAMEDMRMVASVGFKRSYSGKGFAR